MRLGLLRVGAAALATVFANSHAGAQAPVDPNPLPPPAIILPATVPTTPVAPTVAPPVIPTIAPVELPPPVALPVTAPAPSPAPVATPGLVPITPPAPQPPVIAATATSNFSPNQSNGTVAITPAGSPNLVVKQTLPESLSPGQPVNIDVLVTNTGNRSADSVLLTGWWTDGYDVTETSVTAHSVNGRRAWTMGAIAAGESRSLKLKLTPSSTVRPTEFRSGFDATFHTAVSDTRAVKVLKPEVSLQVVGPETVLLGQQLSLQVKVKNIGQLDLKQVGVQILLPDTLSHPNGGKLGTQVADIAMGKEEIIPLNVSVAKTGEGKIKVQIAAPGCEVQEQEIRVTAIDAKLAISLNGPKVTYKDWPVTFEAVIENQSTVVLKGASVEVKLPPGLSDLRASDKPGYDQAGARVVWTIDTLQPGEKKTVLWFGFAKQAEDLQTSATVSIGSLPVKRTEWTTKNAGAEPK